MHEVRLKIEKKPVFNIPITWFLTEKGGKREKVKKIQYFLLKKKKNV